jgi:hypothetical protein
VRLRIQETEQSLHSSLPALRLIFVNCDSTLVGHPVFLRRGTYEQDYAMPLGEYFDQHTLAENKKVIDAYIQAVIQGWRLGFSDTVFNFTINNGFRKGRMIFIDLGEFTFSKQVVSRLVRRQQWLCQWSYTSMEDGRLKRYIATQMNKKLTISRLNREWEVGL